MISTLLIRWCYVCSVLFCSPKMVTTMIRRVITERLNETGAARGKIGIFIRTKRSGAHHHYCAAVVSAVTKRRQPRCPGACPQTKHMPDFSSSEHANLVAYTPAVKTTSLKTGGPSRQGISRASCRRQRVWSWKRLLKVFAGSRARVAGWHLQAWHSTRTTSQATMTSVCSKSQRSFFELLLFYVRLAR